MKMKMIGIIICSRYATCSEGKCVRALRLREGAFSIYRDCGVKLVGYPPCPRLPYFIDYYTTHTRLGTWNSDQWQRLIAPSLSDEPTRTAYD
jgi:hypothetical protein